MAFQLQSFVRTLCIAGSACLPSSARPDTNGITPSPPLVCSTTRTPSPRPTGSTDIPVSTTVVQQQSPLAAVELVYVTNYGAETPVPMTGGCGRGARRQAGWEGVVLRRGWSARTSQHVVWP